VSSLKKSQRVSSKRKVTDSTQKYSKTFKKSSDPEVHPSTSSEDSTTTCHLGFESQSPAVCDNKDIDDAGSVSQPLSQPDKVDIDDTEKCKNV
jgi:hypothetical protein